MDNYYIEYMVSDAPTEVTSYKLYSFFARYGAVENLQKINSHQYLVSMIQTTKTNILLSMRHLEIDGHKCVLEWLRDFGYHLPTIDHHHKPSLPQTILSINDDCLRHIFEDPVLSFKDLTRLAVMCKRFNNIARAVIQSRARRGNVIKQLSHFSSKPLWKIDALLWAFGPAVTALTIEAHSDVLPEIVLKNCENIQTVKYNVEDLSNRSTLISMRRLVTELTEFILKIKSGFDVDLKLLFGSNSKLQTLRINIKTSYTLKMPHIRLPQLEKLQITECNSIDMESFRQFLIVNTQLRTVTLVDATSQCIGHFTDILNSIPNEIVGLTWTRYAAKQSLRIQISENPIVPEPPLQRRPYMRFFPRPNMRRSSFFDWIPFSFNPAQVVDVNEDDEFVAAIRSKRSIKRIRINAISDFQMVRLAQELTQLEEISIDSHAITFAGIRTVLEIGRSLRKVTFYLMGRRRFDNVEIGVISNLRAERNIELKVVNDVGELKEAILAFGPLLESWLHLK